MYAAHGHPSIGLLSAWWMCWVEVAAVALKVGYDGASREICSAVLPTEEVIGQCVLKFLEFGNPIVEECWEIDMYSLIFLR